MKTYIIIFAIIAGIALGLISHMITVADERFERRETEWLQFSEQHRCKVVKNAGFWDGATVWQCDGFSVRRP